MLHETRVRDEAWTVSPTGVERTFDADELIVSKTDRKGVITYANEVFCRTSRYREEEIIGRPHNVVRHPDMPRALSRLLWDTISGGREIFAYVLNLAADGAARGPPRRAGACLRRDGLGDHTGDGAVNRHGPHDAARPHDAELADCRAALAQIGDACERLAAGDFDTRVPPLPGGELANRVRLRLNNTVDIMDAFVREPGASLSAAADGRFYRRFLPAGMVGAFGAAARTIDAAVGDLPPHGRRLAVAVAPGVTSSG